jgi:mono/diheme cytochrome c family protein
MTNAARVWTIVKVLAVVSLCACSDPTRRPPEITTGFAGSSPSTMEPDRPPRGAAGSSAVVTAVKPVPAISGGTLLTLSDGKTAVASDPDRDRVYVVDLEKFDGVRATIPLQEGDEPGRVIEDGAQRVHVALRRGGAVVTIDPAAGTVIARRAVCTAPRGLVYQASGDQVHVACAGGELVSLPAAGGAATRTLTLERDLRDVVVGANDELLVSTFRRAEVIQIAKEGTVLRKVRPGAGMSFSSSKGKRHMSPGVAWRMVPLGGKGIGSVVVLHQMGVDDEIVPAAGGYGSRTGCDAIVGTGVSVLVPGQELPSLANSIATVTLAVDLAISPDGERFALAVPANAGTSFATVVRGPMVNATWASPTIRQAHCEFLPYDPSRLEPPEGQVVAVSFMSDSVLLAQTREPAMLWRSDTSTKLSLAPESRADTGHQLFHADAGGGIACASCHPEGGEDGRSWQFAMMGARRTQSLRGGISQTAPFHWAGDEVDFSALMDDVFVQRMSGPRLSADVKAAVASWVDTIPALPGAAGLDAEAVARGKALFDDAKTGCATCHAGGLMTNNATVDVGTGLPLQVPSLRGLPWRAPFMHDGCAVTLAGRFGMSWCGGDKHGATSHLMPAQVADLMTYLESL